MSDSSNKDVEDVEDLDDLTVQFNIAANHLPMLLPKLDEETLLALYGLYKQGTCGPCDITKKPSWFDFRGKAKYEAWKRLGDMPIVAAKNAYINLIKTSDPCFKLEASEPKTFNDINNSWVTVSRFQIPQDEVRTSAPTNEFLKYIESDDYTQLSISLKGLKGITSANLLSQLDDNGMSLLHWAADRGSCRSLKYLLDLGANVNMTDSDGQTALHYAASCGHLECIRTLLDYKANKEFVDKDGHKPIDVAFDYTVEDLLS